MPTYPSKDIERAALAACGGDAALGRRAPGAADAEDARLPGALVAEVEPGSPADDAGFEPGCRITHAGGQPLRDLIDWRWHGSEDVVELGYVDLDGDAGTMELWREPGESWGLSFDGLVFDGVRQCRNACTFCFMRQLPEGLRPSLTLRDDDFRLSFLAGTFVTLTNLTAADEARIIEQRISPLRVSLHAADPDVRRALIGRHAPHGLEALDRLLAAGIQVDAQVVLVPGANDGDVLRETLEWAYARPGILNVGIVPLGYTRYQHAFDRSFDESQQARAVLEAIAPFQQRALAERGTPWAFAADELYRNAYGAQLLDHLPPAGFYDGFDLFEDGIGIIRSAVDGFRAAVGDGVAARTAEALAAAGLRARLAVGEAMMPYFGQLLEASPLAGLLEPLVVSNGFFGGNVTVTGLLVGCDLATAIRADHERMARAADGGSGSGSVAAGGDRGGAPSGQRDGIFRTLYLVPDVVLNDDGLTLDGMDAQALETAAGCPVAVVPCNPSDYLNRIIALCGARKRP